MGETFGVRLKRMRLEAGLTQERLAELAGVPLGTLRGWEYDRRVPLATMIPSLAGALKVSAGPLLDGLSHTTATGRKPNQPKKRGNK